MCITGKVHWSLDVSGVCCADAAVHDFLTVALLVPSPSCCGGVSQGLCEAELPTKVKLK